LKTFFTAISTKTVEDAIQGLTALEEQHKPEEVEVRQIIPIGQKALVVYFRYDRGVLR
jgi:hypothetical protein